MLNTIVEQLEKYKRLVGRRHSIQQAMKGTKKYNPYKVGELQNEYNITEICIEYLCAEHGATRTSKPYRLGGDKQ